MDVCIVCVYSMFILFCVQVEALQRADHSSKESHRVCKKDYVTEEKAWALNGLEEPLKIK
jgi:hypothetical protein